MAKALSERLLGPVHRAPLGESSPSLSLLCAAGAAISWVSDVGNEVWERLGDSAQPVIQLAVVWCLAHSRFLINN